MTETLLAWVPLWGTPALLVIGALSCFGVPVPGSLALMAGGAIAASGEMALASVLAASFVGAILGDQLGYGLGALGGERAVARLGRRRAFGEALASARSLAERRGMLGVFLSRWLVAPLGPPMNLFAGLIAMPWWRFTLAGTLGEAVWVSLHVGIGFAFSGSILALTALLDDLSWMLAGGAVSSLLAWRLLVVIRSRRLASHAGADEIPG
jgi:membrane-associated protein